MVNVLRNIAPITSPVSLPALGEFIIPFPQFQLETLVRLYFRATRSRNFRRTLHEDILPVIERGVYSSPNLIISRKFDFLDIHDLFILAVFQIKSIQQIGILQVRRVRRYGEYTIQISPVQRKTYQTGIRVTINQPLFSFHRTSIQGFITVTLFRVDDRFIIIQQYMVIQAIHNRRISRFKIPNHQPLDVIAFLVLTDRIRISHHGRIRGFVTVIRSIPQLFFHIL